MSDTDTNALPLRQLARKYLWWKLPDGSPPSARRVIAQVMNIGDFSDVAGLIEAVGEEAFRNVLLSAEPGELSERSWAYWHYRLRMITPDEEPPPLPGRFQ